MGPPEVGFDYAYYFPATNDRVPCIYIENREVAGLEPSDPITVSYRKKVGNEPTGKENPEKLVLPYHLGHDGTIVNGISRIGWMSGGKNALWNDEEMAETMLIKRSRLSVLIRIHHFSFIMRLIMSHEHVSLPMLSGDGLRPVFMAM